MGEPVTGERRWRVWVGAILIVCSGVVEALNVMGVIPPEIATPIFAIIASVGAAFGIVGLGRKMDRLVPPGVPK